MNKPSEKEYFSCSEQVKSCTHRLIRLADLIDYMRDTEKISAEDNAALYADGGSYVESITMRLGKLLESNKDKHESKRVHTLLSFKGINLGKEIDLLIEKAKSRQSNGLRLLRHGVVAHSSAAINQDQDAWLEGLGGNLMEESIRVLVDASQALLLIDERLYYGGTWPEQLRQNRKNLIALRKRITSGKL